MARLIDADELLTRIRLNYNNHQNVSANSIKDIIDTTKTAYDVDAVVEELEVMEEKASKVKNITLSAYACGMMHKAIDIVRKGGVNENNN